MFTFFLIGFLVSQNPVLSNNVVPSNIDCSQAPELEKRMDALENELMRMQINIDDLRNRLGEHQHAIEPDQIKTIVDEMLVNLKIILSRVSGHSHDAKVIQ